MAGPRPHAVWCSRQAIEHAICTRTVAAIDVADGLRLVVQLDRANGVAELVSLNIDRRGGRHLVPLTYRTAGELAAALSTAVNLIDGKV